MNLPGPDPPLPDTDWIEILAATHPDNPEGHAALERVLNRYRRPLLAHLVTKFRFNPDEANDLLQSFFHQKILVDGLLRHANPGRGHLRSFLVNALDRFVLTFLRQRRSHRRHPKGDVVPLHTVCETELPIHLDHADPEGELVWAQAVIAGALLDMHTELHRRGRLEIWSVFEQRVLLPLLDDQPATSYADLIQRFQFKSPSQAFNALVTAKRMFQRHLTSVLTEYAGNNQDLDAELSSLRSILKSALPNPTRTARKPRRTKAKRKTTKRKPRPANPGQTSEPHPTDPDG
jgi:hypothetical protein